MNTLYHIEDANVNYYKKPTLHPSRTMAAHDFIYLLEGAWSVKLADGVHALQPGEVMLLPAGETHYAADYCLPGTKTMYIHARPSGDAMYISETVRLPTVMRDAHGTARALFGKVIESIVPVAGVGNITRARAPAYFLLLLCALSSGGRDIASDDVVSKAIQLMYYNPQTFFTISELASSLQIGERTLRNEFRRKTNVSIHRFQLNQKLESIALQLRLSPEIRLAKLAENFGFYDEFHLSRRFKEKYGVSPQAYRNCQ